jgi:hypothetical protein
MDRPEEVFDLESQRISADPQAPRSSPHLRPQTEPRAELFQTTVWNKRVAQRLYKGESARECMRAQINVIVIPSGGGD